MGVILLRMTVLDHEMDFISEFQILPDISKQILNFIKGLISPAQIWTV